MKTRNYINHATNPDSDCKTQRFSSASTYYKLYETGIGTTGTGKKHRIYIDPDYALVYTYNAAWNGTTWVADQGAASGHPAFRADVGTSFGRSMQIDTSSDWVDIAWSVSGGLADALGRLVLSNAGIISLIMRGITTDETLVPTPNTLYGDNIVKAWVKANIAGGSGGAWSVTSFKGFNIDSITRTSATLGLITFHTGFSSSAEFVGAGTFNNLSDGTPYTLRLSASGVNTMTFSSSSTAGALHDMDAYAGNFVMGAMVLGRQ